MPTYDASDADVFIYARREPDTMLADMGHDVKIRVGDFTIDADFDDRQVDAEFGADSLEAVDAVLWDSKDELGELTDGDRHEIHQRMSRDVLEAEEYPTIEFHSTSIDSTDEGWSVEGELQLHGERHPVTFDATREEGCARVETTIDHTDWGIEQYSAMLDSLKVAPELVVTVEIPLPPES